jgi:hypothetical protein
MTVVRIIILYNTAATGHQESVWVFGRMEMAGTCHGGR